MKKALSFNPLFACAVLTFTLGALLCATSKAHAETRFIPVTINGTVDGLPFLTRTAMLTITRPGVGSSPAEVSLKVNEPSIQWGFIQYDTSLGSTRLANVSIARNQSSTLIYVWSSSLKPTVNYFTAVSLPPFELLAARYMTVGEIVIYSPDDFSRAAVGWIDFWGNSDPSGGYGGKISHYQAQFVGF
jgi:hypothetical protein